jgi:hypothetical protein
MTDTTSIRRKPEKVIEIDESVTKVIVKRRVQDIKIEDECSSKIYLIKRTPIKNGLQMIGT